LLLLKSLFYWREINKIYPNFFSNNLQF